MDVANPEIQEALVGFGRRLKQARQKLGLTGAQLAAKLGLQRSAIAQYEAGRTFPSVGVLKNISRILGLTIDWLVFDEYEAAGEIQDKELAGYIVKADTLPHRDRSMVKDFIDGLLARVELEEAQQARKKGRRAA